MSRYHCITCNFSTNKKYNWEIHINSNKHNKLTGVIIGYTCNICQTQYDNYKEYDKHHKECKIEKRIKIEVENCILKQNADDYCKYAEKQHITTIENEEYKNKFNELDVKYRELQRKYDELQIDYKALEKVIQLCKMNYGPKQSFNLGTYLGENCLHAFDIHCLISIIEITDDVFIKYLREGSNALLNLTIQTLSNYKNTQFPFQCSDEKRQIIHVKIGNNWLCENDYADNTNPLYLYFFKLSNKVYDKMNKMTNEECIIFIKKYDYGGNSVNLKRLVMVEHSKKTMDYESAKMVIKEFKKMLSTKCVIQK